MNIDLLLQQSPALPSIPRVVQELIQTLSKDDVSANEIARQLATDQVLSAKVLRLANSAYYSVPRTISSIDDALRLLGFGTVRTLVVSAGMAVSFKPIPGFDLNRFWRYSLHTAVASKFLGHKIKIDADLAFTIGLLHGIGRLVMLSGMPDEMAKIEPNVSAYPGIDRLKAERKAFGFTYADVGAELTRRWNFPDVFAESIIGAATPLMSEPLSPLHSVVHLASWKAKADEVATSKEELEASWPSTIAGIARVSRELVLKEMPPLKELCAGLEEMVAA